MPPGACKKRDVIAAIDNTWATPLYFQPLKCGVDVSVHAATKYICGHSDMLMGTITCSQPAWAPMRQMLFNMGVAVSPEDAYVALRGLRSLAPRLHQHRATAERLIEWLRTSQRSSAFFTRRGRLPGHLCGIAIDWRDRCSHRLNRTAAHA